MELLSWNIQAAKGVDELVSVERIAAEIKAFSDADVICLQEVLCTQNSNQAQEFASFFPEHTPIFGAAIDRLDGNARLQFGNMVLSRIPVLQLTNHKLPQPAEPAVKHMPRQAIEVVLNYNNALLRVTTLHLDYFATLQRTAQVEYLAAHHAECCSRFLQPSPAGGDAQFLQLAETSNAILCGDFNFNIDSIDYQSMTHSKYPLVDCWRHLHNAAPHDPTCGIYDHVQWQEGPHCRDFFFATKQIAQRLTGMSVNTETAASDHQPLKITIA